MNLSSLFYGDILVDNNIRENRVVGNHGILHNDTVLNDSVLTDINAFRNNGVFDSTVDDTALCNKRVLDRTFKSVFTGNVIIAAGGRSARISENNRRT